MWVAGRGGGPEEGKKEMKFLQSDFCWYRFHDPTQAEAVLGIYICQMDPGSGLSSENDQARDLIAWYRRHCIVQAFGVVIVH